LPFERKAIYLQTKYQTDDYEQYVFRMVVAQLKIEEVVSYTAVWLIERYNRACRSCGRPGFFFAGRQGGMTARP